MTDCHVHGSNCGLVCPVHRMVTPEESPGVRWIPNRESMLRIPYCPERDHPAGDSMMMPLCVLDAREARATFRAHEETIGRLSHELRRIAEGVLGDQPWQANYARIQQVARDALAAAPPGAYEQRVRRDVFAFLEEHFDGDSKLYNGTAVAAAIRALASKDSTPPS